MLRKALSAKCSYYFQFIDEEVEGLRRSVTCLRSCRSHVAKMGEAWALNHYPVPEKLGCRRTLRDQGSFLGTRLLLPYPGLWLPPRFRTSACPSGWNSQPGCSTLTGQLCGAPSATSPLSCSWKVTRPQGPSTTRTGERWLGSVPHSQGWRGCCLSPPCLTPQGPRARQDTEGEGWRGTLAGEALPGRVWSMGPPRWGDDGYPRK